MTAQLCAFMLAGMLHIGSVTPQFQCKVWFSTSFYLWVDAGPAPLQRIEGRVVAPYRGEVRLHLDPPFGDNVVPIPDQSQIQGGTFIYLPNPIEERK